MKANREEAGVSVGCSFGGASVGVFVYSVGDTMTAELDPWDSDWMLGVTSSKDIWFLKDKSLSFVGSVCCVSLAWKFIPEKRPSPDMPSVGAVIYAEADVLSTTGSGYVTAGSG